MVKLDYAESEKMFLTVITTLQKARKAACGDLIMEKLRRSIINIFIFLRLQNHKTCVRLTESKFSETRLITTDLNINLNHVLRYVLIS